MTIRSYAKQISANYEHVISLYKGIQRWTMGYEEAAKEHDRICKFWFIENEKPRIDYQAIHDATIDNYWQAVSHYKGIKGGAKEIRHSAAKERLLERIDGYLLRLKMNIGFFIKQLKGGLMRK